MSKFKVESVFVISVRRLLVIEGELEEGDVFPGMEIRHPLLKAEYLVNSVEVINKNGKETIGITVKYTDAEQVDYFNSIGLEGEVIELEMV